MRDVARLRENGKMEVVFVGAFPPPDTRVFGGNIRDCAVLLGTNSFSDLGLHLIDSTQISIPAPNIWRRLPRTFRRFVTFLRACLVFRPDVVLVFFGSGLGSLEKALLMRVASMLRIPSVAFPRGGGFLLTAQNRNHRTFYRFVFRSASFVCCQGPAQRDYILKLGTHAEYQLPIIPNWVATDELLMVGSSRLTGSSGRHTSHSVNFLFVGWITESKGILDLIDAVVSLRERNDWTLTVAGGGPALERAEARVHASGLADRINFLGPLSRSSLLSAYRNADVLVQPSWVEGFPNSIVEAMACALAVVCTPVGGIPGTLHPEENALFTPSKSPHSLAASLQRLLDDRMLLSRLQAAAYSLALSEFRPETGSRRIIAALHDAAHLPR